MTKCPLCGWANEDGVLFCEKCKSDLAPPAPAFPPVAPADAGRSALARVTDEIFAAGKNWDAAGGGAEADAAGGEPLAASLSLEARGRDAPRSSPASPNPAGRSGSAPALQVDARPKLVVLRGEKLNVHYPIYPGKNYIGRTDEKPVDIDLESQESPDRILCSRQHAVITFENGLLSIEDLNSLNGTFVNRTRIHPGQIRTLQVNDVIQIGTVHLKVLAG